MALAANLNAARSDETAARVLFFALAFRLGVRVGLTQERKRRLAGIAGHVDAFANVVLLRQARHAFLPRRVAFRSFRVRVRVLRKSVLRTHSG